MLGAVEFGAIFGVILVSVFVLTALVLPVLGQVETRYVNPAGEDVGDCITTPCLTIGYAIGQADPSDTIQVATGTYVESLTINEGITLQGAGKTLVTVIGSVTIAASDVVLDGFRIEGTVYVDDSTSDITGVTISNNYITGSSYGIYVGTASNKIISQLTIEYNEIINNAGKGIGFWKVDWQAGNLHDVTIRGNTISGGGDSGISTYGAGPYIIVDNIVTGNAGNGISIKYDDGDVISGNTVTGNDAMGINMHQVTNTTVEDNTVSGHVSEEVVTTFWGGSIVAGKGSAIYVHEVSQNNIIRLNDLTGNKIGVLISREPGSDGEPSSNSINNNKITGNTEYGILNALVDPPTPVDAENNWWGSLDGPSHSPGSGDKVSDNVDYDPWCANQECTETGTEESIFAGNCNDEFDNDYDGLMDCADPDCWDFVRDCGGGICAGTQTCTAGVWGPCSTSDEFCGIKDCYDRCDIDFNLATYDYANFVLMKCTDHGYCEPITECNYEHYCADDDPLDGIPLVGGVCVAECDQDDDCAATDCDYLDGCHNDGSGEKKYDCSDVPNDCLADCTCEDNACHDPLTCVQTGTDGDGDGWDVECGDCDDTDATVYPRASELCDNKDNNCDGSIDEDLTISCGEGDCEGISTCTAGEWSDCSTSGDDCGVCALCDSEGYCTVYDETQDSDCDPFDLFELGICIWNPDYYDLTWDYHAAIDSECKVIFECTYESGYYDYAHTCDIEKCGAECEADADCSDTECDYLDGCYEDTYRDYHDVPNTCIDCLCTKDECTLYTEIITDKDGDGYDIECDNDCDDADPAINPGATEVCNDGIDNDCDGHVDCEDHEDCDGKQGPHGHKCCDAPSDCTQRDCTIESCDVGGTNECVYTARPENDNIEVTKTCYYCDGTNRESQPYSGNDGIDCVDDCTYCNVGVCENRPADATDECGTCEACDVAGGNCAGIDAETGKNCEMDCYDCVGGTCTAMTEDNDDGCDDDCDSCIEGNCVDRQVCDNTECTGQEACNALGGDCADPDADNTVCTQCYDAVFNGFFFEPGTTASCCDDDIGENYITLGIGTEACCDSPTDCVDSNGICRDEYPNEQTCNDEIDNDCDGLIDCEDQDCLDTDITKPEIIKTVGDPEYGEGYYVTTSTPITLTATDYGNPCVVGLDYIHYEIWWDSDDDGEIDMMVEEDDVYDDIVTLYFGEESLHELRWYAVDMNGNEEEENTQEHEVDDSAPVITPVWPEDGEVVYQECFEILFNMSDLKAGLADGWMMVDGEEIDEEDLNLYLDPPWNPPWEVRIGYDDCWAVGEHTVTVNVTDGLGHNSELTWSFEVKDLYEMPELYYGWNLISLPLIPEDSSIEAVLNDISDKVDSVWSYDTLNDEWYVYIPGGPGDLDEMKDGLGYWMRMNTGAEEDEWVIYGVEFLPPPAIPPEYLVYEGWNLIGFKSAQELPDMIYLLSIYGKYTSPIAYDPEDGFYSIWTEFEEYYPWGWMEPGYGYWLYVIEDGVIAPPAGFEI